MSNNVKALIAEIKSDLSKYDDSGLIDDNSIYRDIVLAVKKFGNDVMTKQEEVIEVSDNKGSLPIGFYSLIMAVLCEPASISTELQIDSLQQSYFYKEKVINNKKWCSCDASCETEEENIIRENIYFNGSRTTFNYKNPILLGLNKHMDRSSLAFNCRNNIVRDNPFEISVSRGTIHSNFEQGSIYIQYYGLPEEDGLIVLPETPNGNLELYIEYFVKRRITERLIANNDAQGLQSLYPTYLQQEQVYLINTRSELKMNNLGKDFYKGIAKNNKLKSKQFEIILR
jgi:hypothetical protein